MYKQVIIEFILIHTQSFIKPAHTKKAWVWYNASHYITVIMKNALEQILYLYIMTEIVFCFFFFGGGGVATQLMLQKKNTGRKMLTM